LNDNESNLWFSAYTDLVNAMLALRQIDPDLSDLVADILDPIWLKLTQTQKDLLKDTNYIKQGLET
jgi:hypothetical protein